MVLYQSLVEVRSIRRRASRLLKPIPGTQIKPKTREIILTNHRLICLKTKNSPTRSSVKSELFIKAGEEGKEKEKKKDGKDAKGILVSAELKGDREFAVLSVSLSASALLSPLSCVFSRLKRSITRQRMHQLLLSLWRRSTQRYRL